VLVLSIGLRLAALGFLAATLLSIQAGFPPDMALLRGSLAFIAISFVAYIGELVIATAPRAVATVPRPEGGDATEGTAVAAADDLEEGPPQRGAGELARLPEASDQRRAA
jgi:hypothetical protein